MNKDQLIKSGNKVERKPSVIRLNSEGHSQTGMSPWMTVPLVGEIVDGEPQERFYRVFEKMVNSPSKVRAGVWEATTYAENLINYPYHEIVFLLEGSISIIDDDSNEELFEPGDCFFLEQGFNGQWKQHDTIKIFHMTVAPT